MSSGSWGLLNWFGGPTKKKDSAKDAILGLRSQLEMLSKREKHLQSQIDEQDTLARKYLSTNKNAAKAALRRKKLCETALDQTNAQIMTLEREIYSIESANINKETLLAMQQASKAMQQIHGKLNPDKVDEIMEKLREQHAIGEEIGEAITQSPSLNIAADDDLELEDELEQLQQQELDSKMAKAGIVPVVPSRLQQPGSGVASSSQDALPIPFTATVKNQTIAISPARSSSINASVPQHRLSSLDPSLASSSTATTIMNETESISYSSLMPPGELAIPPSGSAEGSITDAEEEELRKLQAEMAI